MGHPFRVSAPGGREAVELLGLLVVLGWHLTNGKWEDCRQQPQLGNSALWQSWGSRGPAGAQGKLWVPCWAHLEVNSKPLFKEIQ